MLRSWVVVAVAVVVDLCGAVELCRPNATNGGEYPWDCEYRNEEGCAAYNGEFEDPSDNAALLVVGGIIMAAMAFGIGGNDVANAWGTSVGSGAVSLRTACVIAGLANWWDAPVQTTNATQTTTTTLSRTTPGHVHHRLGAVTLGYGVSSKITKGVSNVKDPDCWACGKCNSFMGVYAVAMLSALIAGACFLMLATYSRMPVSTTHAIVGGVVGSTIIGVGGKCLNWAFDGGLGGIVASWVISPALSGAIGAGMYFATDKLIMQHPDKKNRAIMAVPFLYSLTTLILTFMILIKAGPTKKMALGVQFGIAIAFAAVTLLVSALVVVPVIKRRLPSAKTTTELKTQMTGAAAGMPLTTTARLVDYVYTFFTCFGVFGHAKGPEKSRARSRSVVETKVEEEQTMDVDTRDAGFCFRYLLVFNAGLESFAHGANDTANSTAAFSALYGSYHDGLHGCSKADTPWWIMGIGGFFVLLGINSVGYRVIQTIGEQVTAINFHRGYCMEFASTLTVVIATLLEFPVSTTHCQIGAVTFVGLAAFGKDKVEWKMLGQIVLSWVITLPFAGLLSFLLTGASGFIVLNRNVN